MNTSGIPITPTAAEDLKTADNASFSKLRGVDCLAAFAGQRAAISFTGGKDCHLALQRCIDAGLHVVCGAVFFSPDKTFHAHRVEWQRIQGGAMKIPIVDCCLTDLNQNPTDYHAAYAGAIRKLQQKEDIQVLVTGDIDYVFDSTTNFMQQVSTEQECNGVQVLLPLWQQPRKDLLREMLEKYEFDIRLCCVKTPHFDESWIGRQLDAIAMEEMETKVTDGLDLTGENGEYHTMVVDGPMYKDCSLQFVDVKPQELLEQRGQKDGERWWVMAGTTKLIPQEN